MSCSVYDPMWTMLLTQTPNKILKIISVNFIAFRCGVCAANLRSLASKLWEETIRTLLEKTINQYSEGSG